MTACVSRAWAMDKYLEVENLEWAAGFNEATASGANRVGLAEGVFLCCLLLDHGSRESADYGGGRCGPRVRPGTGARPVELCHAARMTYSEDRRRIH